VVGSVTLTNRVKKPCSPAETSGVGVAMFSDVSLATVVNHAGVDVGQVEPGPGDP
jgi:hypothetical protein